MAITKKVQSRVRKVIHTKCEYCGKEIVKKLKDFNGAKHHFCSKRCYAKSMEKRVEVTCEYCKKKFYKRPSSVKKINFCNVKCQRKWLSINNTKVSYTLGKHYNIGNANWKKKDMSKKKVIKQTNKPVKVHCFDSVKVKCDYCHKTFIKPRRMVSKHNFCCVDHYRKWLSIYDKTENPMNKKGCWTLEERMKKREYVLSHCKDNGRAYKKYLGRHMHRVVAERMLGRPLRKNEVVHHIDGNKLNNNPKNLMVMTIAEHARLHMKQMWKENKFKKRTEKFKGDDSERRL